MERHCVVHCDREFYQGNQGIISEFWMDFVLYKNDLGIESVLTMNLRRVMEILEIFIFVRNARIRVSESAWGRSFQYGKKIGSRIEPVSCHDFPQRQLDNPFCILINVKFCV